MSSVPTNPDTMNRTVLSSKETEYLNSFLENGDRGGFYMAYYAMSSFSHQNGLLESPVGQFEASLQTKIATFSGPVGATAYYANRVLQTAAAPGVYPGIYFLSQKVAEAGSQGVDADIDAGKTGFISDQDFFQTAVQAWNGNNVTMLFPGNLLPPNAATAGVTTIGLVAGYVAYLADYVSQHGSLPSAQTMRDWIGERGERAGALAALYVNAHDITGKLVDDYATKAGYSIVLSSDGYQKLAIRDSDGHVVANELVGISGAGQYELAPSLFPLLTAAINAGTIVLGSLGAMGISTAQDLFRLAIDPVFAPHDPSDWTTLSFPVGDGAGASTVVPNGMTTTPFRTGASSAGGNDTLVGTSGDQFTSGADTINGGNGNDAIFAGSGDDVLSGDAGDDLLWGQDGDDRLDGGSGDDVLRGGAGNDTLLGSEGTDIIDGGDPTLLPAMTGTDTVDYSFLPAGSSVTVNLGVGTPGEHAAGVLQVAKQTGTDTLASIDRIIGTKQNDAIVLKAGADTQFAKIVYIDLGENLAPVQVDGSRPVDSIVATDFDGALSFDLRDRGDQQVIAANGATLALRNVSGVLGTAFADTMFGAQTGDALSTNSALYGGAGNDLIFGYAGRNVLYGEAGDDVISSSGTNDFISGGAGNDVVRLLSGSTATVIFGMGDGKDVVRYAADQGGYNLKLEGLGVSDISIIAGGSDNSYQALGDVGQHNVQFLVFKIDATGETITFAQEGADIGARSATQYLKNGIAYASAHNPVQSVIFKDGVTWSASDLWTRIQDHASYGGISSHMMTDSEREEGYGFAGPRAKAAKYLHDINLEYFAADPVRPAPQMIAGSSGADYIYDDGGDDTVTPGGGDDNVTLTAGNDRILWNFGTGDTSIDATGQYNGSDVIKIGGPLSASDLTIDIDNYGSVTVTTSSQTGSLRLSNQYFATAGDGDVSLELADGTRISHADMMAAGAASIAANHQTINGTSQDDWASVPSFNFTYSGLGGDDTIYTSSSPGGGQFVLAHGDGNDSFSGYAGRTDVLYLSDSLPQDVTLQIMPSSSWWQPDPSLMITLSNSGGSFSVTDQFPDDPSRQPGGISAIRFMDGTVWDRAQIASAASSGTSSSMQANGSEPAPTFAVRPYALQSSGDFAPMLASRQLVEAMATFAPNAAMTDMDREWFSPLGQETIHSLVNTHYKQAQLA